jgi:hypothetical protein
MPFEKLCGTEVRGRTAGRFVSSSGDLITLLRVGCGQSEGQPVLSHFIFLMRANTRVAARYRRAQQHEPFFGIFRKIRIGSAIIYFPLADYSSCTG